MIRSRSGVALVGALFALAVIGALVAGGFFAGRVEHQSGQNVLYAAQAREAAEAGLARSLADVDAASLETLPAGGAPLDLGVAAVGEVATVHSTLARLTAELFLLSAQGVRHDAGGGALATRRLGLLLRFEDGSGGPAEPTASRSLGRVTERAWLRLN